LLNTQKLKYTNDCLLKIVLLNCSCSLPGTAKKGQSNMWWSCRINYQCKCWEVLHYND